MNEQITVKKIKVECKDMINYTYIIVDNNSNNCVIIDPAWQLEKIINFIDINRLKVNSIFLTHSHHDHVNLVYYLVNAYNCTVYISKIEKEYYNFQSENLSLLKNNAVLQINKITIHVLITPGHTKGSACYFVNDRFLFTGDTLFIEGCGNSSQQGGDAGEMFRSIQLLKEIIPNQCIIYPGHAFTEKPGKKFSQIKSRNIYLQIISEDTFIKLSKMQENKSVKYI